MCDIKVRYMTLAPRASPPTCYSPLLNKEPPMGCPLMCILLQVNELCLRKPTKREEQVLTQFYTISALVAPWNVSFMKNL